MKYLITLLLILNSLVTFSQTKKDYKEKEISTVYMIDETWSPRSAARWGVDNDSYLQIISEKYFVMSYRVRGKDYYYEGDIESWVKDQYKLHFWVRGRNISAGKAILSFDLLYDKDKKHVHIHIYNSLGKFDTYYSGHLATKEEIEELLKYTRKD